jgi:adenylate cyclase
MSLFDELKRRNVIRVASAYAVTAWLLVQVAETIFPVLGLGETAFRIVVIVLAVGIVPLFAIAWAFEWTPDGLKLDSDVAHDSDTRKISGRFLDRTFLVVLALAVGYFAIDKFVFDPARDAAREQEATERGRSEAITGFYGDRSIAVLPFVNMSSDPEQEFFADGISEEILNLLARIRELRVISRSSAFTFKGKDIEIPEIAEQLNVGHILEGSVRKSGGRVRVTAQLIEARTDAHLWSQTYDRDLEDIFAIQDEIARDVAKNLELKLLQPLPRSRITDPEVHALTLQANHLLQTRPSGLGEDMLALLAKALEIDPDYVPALELIATANWFRMYEGLITKEEEHDLQVPIRARILRLDPDNATIIASDGWDEFRENANYELAAELFERAVANGLSKSEVIRIASTFATRIGRLETAIRLAEHAAAIDPLCFQCLYWVSRTNMYAGNYDRALEARERFLRLGSSGGEFHYGLIKLLQGDPAAALAIYEAMEEADGDPMQFAGLAMAHHDLGNIEEARKSFELLRESADDQFERFNPTLAAAAWMGDNDTAFGLIEQLVNYEASAADHYYESHGLVFNPAFKRLRSDPRWAEFRNSIGMSEERLAAIQFNPELPE